MQEIIIPIDADGLIVKATETGTNHFISVESQQKKNTSRPILLIEIRRKGSSQYETIEHFKIDIDDNFRFTAPVDEYRFTVIGGDNCGINQVTLSDTATAGENSNDHLDTELMDKLLSGGDYLGANYANLADLNAKQPDAPEGSWAIIADDGGDPTSPAIVRNNGTGFEAIATGTGGSGDTNYIELLDTFNGNTIRLSVRDGAFILTDETEEILNTVDLGGISIAQTNDIALNGEGKYTTTSAAYGYNDAGLVSQEYINTPGQFFVVNDFYGDGQFGPGDRQCFGLVRETIFDSTDLSGGNAPFVSGSAKGGWSMAPFWYYVGGKPYIWTFGADTAQPPGGTGESLTGPMSSQTDQRDYVEQCERLGLGPKLRVGIAAADSDQSGAVYTNRLVLQLYIYQEIIDDPTAFATMPSAVQNNGAGYYTAFATGGDFEFMGTFPDGQDKGYRFKWVGFSGNTTLNQLPSITGVSNNDQIAAAKGLSYYLVYSPTAADIAAANSELATGTCAANNITNPGETAKILQYNNPYTSFEATDVVDLSFTEASRLTKSPLFNNYNISTVSEIESSVKQAEAVQLMRQALCTDIKEKVIGYYQIVDLSLVDEQTVVAYFAVGLQAANAGQLENLYRVVHAYTPTALVPQELIDYLKGLALAAITKYPVH